MKTSNANKVISVLVSVAMCPMMLPTAAFAAENDATSSTSSSVEQAQPANQAEGVEEGAGSSNDTLASQPEAGNTGDATASEETSTPATTTEKAEATEDEAATLAAETGEEGNEAAVAEVNGKTYPSLQDAINAAPRKATVKLLADTKENVTISTPYVTLDLNGHTLNGGTGQRKPALTVTAASTVMDCSEAKTGTIMREDTAENSGVCSHYVIDVQGGNTAGSSFESGNVTNNSGTSGTVVHPLVRVGDDSKPSTPA